MQLKPKQPPKHNSRQTRTKQAAMPTPRQLDLTSSTLDWYTFWKRLSLKTVLSLSPFRLELEYEFRISIQFQTLPPPSYATGVKANAPGLCLKSGIHIRSRMLPNLKVPKACKQTLVFGFRTQALLSGFSLWCASRLTNETRCGTNGSSRVSLSGLRR